LDFQSLYNLELTLKNPVKLINKLKTLFYYGNVKENTIFTGKGILYKVKEQLYIEGIWSENNLIEKEVRIAYYNGDL
jgi:hypothetical protein